MFDSDELCHLKTARHIHFRAVACRWRLPTMKKSGAHDASWDYLMFPYLTYYGTITVNNMDAVQLNENTITLSSIDTKFLRELYVESDNPYVANVHTVAIYQNVADSLLFRLPREIRNRIWIFVVETTNLPRTLLRKQALQSVPKSNAAANATRPHKCFISTPNRFLRTCRAINKEATHMLFKIVPLRVYPYPRANISRFAFERIRDVTYVVSVAKHLQWEWADLWRALCPLQNLARSGLQLLRIRIECRSNPGCLTNMLGHMLHQAAIFRIFPRIVISVERVPGYCCCRFQDAQAQDPHRQRMEKFVKDAKDTLGEGIWWENIVNGEAIERIEFRPPQLNRQATISIAQLKGLCCEVPGCSHYCARKWV